MTPRILIVDDETNTCEIMAHYIASWGYEVYTASNGREALELIESIHPHMMLLDVRMPEMSGLELLNRLDLEKSNMGVIMLTAVQEAETAREALSRGAYDYITKPIDLEYLETALHLKLTDILS